MAEAEPQLSEEEEEVAERSPPTAKVVHAAVSKQGEDELDRPIKSLLWWGIAAGIAIMASVTAQAALAKGLPEAPWKESFTALGYSVGFLIVILGRMQLFTEHTTVAVLPLARDMTWANFRRTARLWAAVFIGNVIGAAAAAALVVYGKVQSEELLHGMVKVSSKLLEKAPLEMMLQGIPAGFLIASVAWIRSAADDSSFWIVLAITWVIGAGGFTHVVAGAAEAFLLLWHGEATGGWVLYGFLVPAFVGNVIGGTGLFAMLAHAQVKDEI
jgi:formate/nitrite transporter FocA (FNT family)